MNKKILPLLCFLFSINVFGQTKDSLPPVDSIIDRFIPIYFNAIKSGIFDQAKDTSWNLLQTLETDAYVLKVPKSWIKFGSHGTLVDQAFDASELYFTDTYNSKPVLVGLFILNQASTSLDEAKTKCLQGYRSNPDRVFETNYIDTASKTKLKTGQDAYILHTRFFRNSTQLNQSRYDLVVYSDIKKQGYIIMVSIQYSDGTYNFERSNNLFEFANKIFYTFSLK